MRAAEVFFVTRTQCCNHLFIILLILDIQGGAFNRLQGNISETADCKQKYIWDEAAGRQGTLFNTKSNLLKRCSVTNVNKQSIN